MITVICALTGASLLSIFIAFLLEDLKRKRWHKKATHQPLSQMTFDDLVDEINMTYELPATNTTQQAQQVNQAKSKIHQ